MNCMFKIVVVSSLPADCEGHTHWPDAGILPGVSPREGASQPGGLPAGDPLPAPPPPGGLLHGRHHGDPHGVHQSGPGCVGVRLHPLTDPAHLRKCLVSSRIGGGGAPHLMRGELLLGGSPMRGFRGCPLFLGGSPAPFDRQA